MTLKHQYPRPQLQRSDWTSLNGLWDFALDPDGRWGQASEVAWARSIEVPFSPETPASGIGETGFYRACWYRRTVEVPELEAGERLILHFGAVDHDTTVWVNDRLAVRHEGGYTPFHADITPLLNDSGPLTIVVRAEDDPHDLAKPRGKQDWQLDPHGIWYPRTTGIWQTVWLERLPATSIASLRWTPSVVNWEIALNAAVAGARRDDLRLHVTLRVGERLLADDSYRVVDGEVSRRIALADPGIDDLRFELMWTPMWPTLIEAQLRLLDERGTVLDEVRSYTAMREVSIHGDRFVLNGRPYTLRLALDQGYWEESGLTAPDDAALRRNVELAKAMGFNGVRKHQKIEDPRYLYWADRLGLLVWEEMPSAYSFTRKAVERLTSTWTAAIERDYSHPCIVTWVPFNESWGVPDLPDNPQHRDYIQALYHLTKTLDPTRPVVSNDGWELATTDIITIHDYASDPDVLARRYHADEPASLICARERPAGRQITLNDHPYEGQPIMLTEFGGIAYSDDPEHTWGYSRSENAEEFAQEYTALLETVRSLKVMSGFCYTQFADTYQESNGLLYADRTPKFPLEQISRATRGELTRWEIKLEEEWRQRVAQLDAEVASR